MNKVNKIIIYLFSFITITMVVGITIIYSLISSSIPDYELEFSSDDIENEIVILRDNYAVPHIFAKNTNDTFFALGFVHAQDRLWQMEFMRRLSQGRLSEILGERYLQSDILMRTLNLYNISNEALSFQDGKILEKLISYSNGVNQRLKQISSEGLGRGAPEFFLHSKTISPWSPVDSLAIQKLLAFQSSGKFYAEIVRSRLKLSGITDIMVSDLLEEIDINTNLSKTESSFNQYYSKKIGVEPFENLKHGQYLDSRAASNIWAVSPKRSANSSTIAATDPHTALTSPSLWMLAHIDYNDNYVYGGTIPGIPAILVGRNKNFGWGWSSTFADDQDLLIEKLNPENSDQYISSTKDGRKLEEILSRQVIIEIEDLPGKTISVKATNNGPILPNSFARLKDIVPPGHVASLLWTGFDPNDRSLASFINLMEASGVADARMILKDFHSPIQNFLLVDKENIAIQVAGKIPMRNKLHSTKGRYPALSFLEENLWSEYLDYQDNPFILNPKNGIVANTNNQIGKNTFPKHLSFQWGDTQRILRLNNLLKMREFHTTQSFIDIQTDTVSITARIILPLLGKNLWYQDTFQPNDENNERRRIALNLLAEWNGNMRVHDPEPLIFTAWLDAFQRRLISDELGTLSRDIKKVKPLFLEKVLKDVNGASKWCDVIQTPRTETCEMIAKKSLDDSLAWLSLKFGSRVESWRWGDAHTSVHRSNTLGQIPLISYLSNIVQETPGGQNTLMSGEYIGHGDNPYIQNRGSGLRAIYDFSEENKSFFIISTGQSGNPLSRHYDDMISMWKLGEYIPTIIDKTVIEGSGAKKTVISKIITKD